MKKHFNLIMDRLRTFIDNEPAQPNPDKAAIKLAKLLPILKEAQTRSSALHVIYGRKSFTGDLIKLDLDSQKIILKNFTKNISVIIALADIDKISLVPEAISHSQKTRS